jgi:3-deoxy-D-manno-octulosonic acid kinase
MTAPAAVPSDYVSERLGGVTLVARAASLAAARSMIEEAGSLQRYAAARGVALDARGRATARRVAAADDAWVVRHYQRGGRVARLLDDRYVRLGEARPLRELAASTEARRRGIRTPRIEALCIRPAGIIYRADIATRFVASAADLATLLLRGVASDAAVWRAAGALLRDVFAAAVVHPDLNLGNVLIERTADGPVAHLLDLDRARVERHADARRRARMLARFERSRLKLERLAGAGTPAGCLAAFAEAVRG